MKKKKKERKKKLTSPKSAHFSIKYPPHGNGDSRITQPEMGEKPEEMQDLSGSSAR